MRFFAISLSLVFLCLSSANAETTRMAVKFGGGPGGENTYTVNPDGTFISTTKLILGTITLNSVITGKMEGGRITEYRCESNDPSGEVAVLTLANGKIHVKTSKIDTDAPGTVGSEPYFGNLHPQFTASALASVDITNKVAQPIKCFCPDAGAMLTPKFTPKGVKTTPIGPARIYQANLPTVEITYALDSSNRVVMMDVPAQRLRFLVPGWEGLTNDPLAAFPELSQPTFKVKIERAVTMKTRDGVKLVQDVIRPDAPGKYPTILERTPYGRDSATVEGPFYASRGYVFIVQDCRGRNDSDGNWDPFMAERKDGYDTVQWAASQPWSDGSVGMIGGSYGGLVQWAAAVEAPPALKCIVPQVSPPDAMLNIPYDNGVFFLYGAVWRANIGNMVLVIMMQSR